MPEATGTPIGTGHAIYDGIGSVLFQMARTTRQ